MFFQGSLRRKIVAIGVLQLLMVSGVLFYLNYRQAKQTAEEQCVSQAKSIILTAESIREEMARKWELGLFSQQQLTEWNKRGELEKVLGAVPVVTAWKSAMAKAKEGGYEFRVPKFSPRNPKNTPDPVETRAGGFCPGELERVLRNRLRPQRRPFLPSHPVDTRMPPLSRRSGHINGLVGQQRGA